MWECFRKWKLFLCNNSFRSFMIISMTQLWLASNKQDINRFRRHLKLASSVEVIRSTSINFWSRALVEILVLIMSTTSNNFTNRILVSLKLLMVWQRFGNFIVEHNSWLTKLSRLNSTFQCPYGDTVTRDYRIPRSFSAYEYIFWTRRLTLLELWEKLWTTKLQIW